MKRSTSPKGLRTHAMRALAWFLFALTTAIMITGAVVQPTSSVMAQDEAPAVVKGDATAAAGDPKTDAPALDTSKETIPETKPGEPKDVVKEKAPKEPIKAEATPEATPEKKKTISLRDGEGGLKDDSTLLDRGLSLFGILVLIGVAVLLSNNRRAINWRLVGVGVALQLVFALVIFYVPGGRWVFDGATTVISKLLDFTGEGSKFIFSSYVTGKWEPGLINFTFAVLPTIIFFSSLMTIMYHLGLMQRIVYVFAKVMQKAMGTSGAESLSAAANIFVGQTEAPLVIKPYVDKMTNSELMTVMTGGFATVAGGVLAIYVGMLKPSFPEIAGHLLAASVMSAPAALVIGKIIYPETEVPETSGDISMSDEKEDTNVIDAASRGAAEGLKLALNVGAMLLAFIALVGLINYIIGLPSLLYNKGTLKDLYEAFVVAKIAVPAGCVPEGVADAKVVECIETMSKNPAVASIAADISVWPMITLQGILGYLFWPFAFVMGVPAKDCMLIGQLLGEKMILNELIAYSSLQKMLLDPNIVLSKRSVIIATYALCGFANVGSIGIQLGGIGGIAPSRKADLAKIAVKAMLAGTLAAFMTATVAGVLV